MLKSQSFCRWEHHYYTHSRSHACLSAVWPDWAFFESFFVIIGLTKVAQKICRHLRLFKNWPFWNKNCCGEIFDHFWKKFKVLIPTIWSHCSRASSLLQLDTHERTWKSFIPTYIVAADIAWAADKKVKIKFCETLEGAVGSALQKTIVRYILPRSIDFYC